MLFRQERFCGQNGLSLVELMISITLGLILMAGVLQLFLSSKVTFNAQEGISRIQESGRLAMNFIAKDVRSAGFTGFRSVTGITGINVANYLGTITADNNFQESISVFAAPISGVASLAGTQSLAVRGVFLGPSVEVTSFNLGSINTKSGLQNCDKAAVAVSDTCANRPLIIADYFKAAVFQPNSIKGGVDTVITFAGSWGVDTLTPSDYFIPGSRVSPIDTVIYYISTGANGQPSLFKKENGVAFELIQGVKNMAFTYSRRDTPDTYLNAAGGSGVKSIGELNALLTKVNPDQAILKNPPISLRVELLVQSNSTGVVESDQSYVFNGVTTLGKDRRMYQVFRTTIALRNQMQ